MEEIGKPAKSAAPEKSKAKGLAIRHGWINADKTDPRPVDQYHTMQRMLQEEDGSNYLTVLP